MTDKTKEPITPDQVATIASVLRSDGDGQIADLLERLQAENERLDTSETKLIRERDALQQALQDTHVALGGDGEWCARIPEPNPPDSGDLRMDVPALAAALVAERDSLRAANETAWLIEWHYHDNLHYLGELWGSMRWVSVDGAMRFARKQDAESALDCYRKANNELQRDCYNLDYRVAEHMWPLPPTPTDAVPTDGGTRG
jgi:hypothetical protein